MALCSASMPSKALALCVLLALANWPGLSNAADLAPLGRLLTSPAQRAKLDELRKSTGKSIPQISNNNDDVIIVPQRKTVAEPVAAPPAPPAPILFNGFVQRSDGSTTTWFNQEAQSSHMGVKNRAPSQLHMTLPSGKQVNLKPGQSVLPSDASVSDELADGMVKVNRAPDPAAPPKPSRR